MEPQEKTARIEDLRNIIYKLIMEKDLTEEEKEIIEKIVEEKKYS